MNINQLLKSCSEKIISLEQIFPLSQFQRRIEEIDHLSNNPNFWNDSRNASSLMKERQKISDIFDKLKRFKDQIYFNIEFVNSYPEESDELLKETNSLYQEMCDLEFKQMLSQPEDNTPAILTINAGAGGLEAANWVTMLLRMYLRYANSEGFTAEILDMKPSEEHSSICTDSVSIKITGEYAYGFLKGESGVHRLIRNSPFNAADARQTSCAGVYVTPDIEDVIDIKIEDKDIEITAQTAGGPGGQNQNRIKSAIRIKHFPTGINIIVRAERNQLSNKRVALKMLKSKLYALELEKKQSKINEQISNLTEVSFGHQIRTYYINPYKLVTDHRTDYQSSDVNKVLDGDLKEFILAFLRK